MSGRLTKSSRRRFLQSTAAAAAATPLLLHADDKADARNKRVGEGEHTYECHHGWGKLPKSVEWGATHGVCIDREGLIYIKHQHGGNQPMDAIVVFDPSGKAVRSFGKAYHGGGHGIDIRSEGGQEFLYLSDVKNRQVIKTDLVGEVVWKKAFPQEPGVYKNASGYRPTNVAFAPDGGFYIGDGYGSHYIHQYDHQAQWVRTWGGAGTEPGKMRTPHGMWFDDRPGRAPALAVADRANARLQYFSPTGEHLGFVNGLLFPADIDIQGDVMLVADLHARLTLLDRQNQVITHLGDDPKWRAAALADGLKMRRQRERWVDGKFIHPHDACFDQAGNIYVTEWVEGGRVTFLKKVG